MSALAWFAVMTSPQREEIADRNLRRERFETYFPHECQWLGKDKHKARLVRRPVMNRYLFVRSKLERIHEVNDTQGVATVLHAPGGEPFPIPEEVMAALKARFGPDGKAYRTRERKLRFLGAAGQMFRFGDKSPFFGFIAEIICVLDNDRLKARLLESLFGASGREMVVPLADVGELLEAKAIKTGT